MHAYIRAILAVLAMPYRTYLMSMIDVLINKDFVVFDNRDVYFYSSSSD